MLVERGVIKVGVEIEVPAWNNGRTYEDVCAELIEHDYMMGPHSLWTEHHEYHCNCTRGGCMTVKKGVLLNRPLVSMTYDASLPREGAEFIMSPILLTEEGMKHFHRIWNIIVEDAEWTDELENWYENGTCSPSTHLHVSATKKEYDGYAPTPTAYHNLPDNVWHALGLFSPELFLLADLCNYRRGINYRWPTKESILLDTSSTPEHHGFIHVKKLIPDKISYIEWRLFEAAYDDWEYIEAATYLSAALTRGLLNHKQYQRLMSLGYANAYDPQFLYQAAEARSIEKVLEAVDLERLSSLEMVALTNIDDDDYGREVITKLFERANKKVGAS